MDECDDVNLMIVERRSQIFELKFLGWVIPIRSVGNREERRKGKKNRLKKKKKREREEDSKKRRERGEKKKERNK